MIEKKRPIVINVIISATLLKVKVLSAKAVKHEKPIPIMIGAKYKESAKVIFAFFRLKHIYNITPIIIKQASIMVKIRTVLFARIFDNSA